MSNVVKCPLCHSQTPIVKRVYFRAYHKYEKTDLIHCSKCKRLIIDERYQPGKLGNDEKFKSK